LGLRKPATSVVKDLEDEQVLRLSHDDGATWQDAPALRIGNAGNVLRIEPDGSLLHMYGQEASCGGGGQYRVRLAPGAADVPAAITARAQVDSGGRLITIASGHVVRWSAAGWEVLLPG